MLDILLNKRSDLCPVRFCRNPRSPIEHKKGGVCSRCSMREWRKNNPVKAAFTNLRQNASRRRKPFQLTFDEFSQWCEANHYIELRGREATCAQIDRIDYRRGYSLDNIQILSCSENSIKGQEEKRALHEVEEPF